MQYCLKVEAPGYLPQYAAVMMPKDAAADANSTIVHFFKMSKTNRVPVATLGAGKIDSCPVDDTNVKAAPQSSDKHLVTLSCSETELKEQPDGGFELVCINYCNELEMMPGDKRSTFRAMCIGND